MKVYMEMTGMLTIESQSQIESYALNKWIDENDKLCELNIIINTKYP